MPSTRNASSKNKISQNQNQIAQNVKKNQQVPVTDLPRKNKNKIGEEGIKRTRAQKQTQNKQQQDTQTNQEKPKPEPRRGRSAKKNNEDQNELSPSNDGNPSKQTQDKAETQAQPQPIQNNSDLKKLLLKGKGTIPVDQYFSKATQYKIYCDSGKTYAATLNQSNIQANNNKFYIIQLLQHQSSPNDFILFTRWGRVGVQGQSSQNIYKNKDIALKEYNKKFNDKKKTYKEVEMNYEENAKEQQEDKPKKEGPASTLHPQVQDLIRLIFDMKMMNKQLKQIGYDANKMPLGKLAKSSILKGYSILQEIMTELKGSNRKQVINSLSGDFYSQIPHNFGFEKMQKFALDTEKKVKDKLQMLQSIEDIQVFTKLIDQGKEDSDMNILDSNYHKLATKIVPLDRASPTYQLLLEYVANTHASTHTAYRLEVEDIFQLVKEEQASRFRTDIANKQLLWHGSRLTNFVGILSQGLRIAPPQAPVTGYMFGKGVYFADMVTKSANYCFASRENNTGLMLLCEVALGTPNQKFYADYYANLLPQGKHSTKGCGKTAPSEGKMLGDVLVPCGKGAQTGITNCSLLYNEFIVYDVAQIKCRYLFKMKFHYN